MSWNDPDRDLLDFLDRHVDDERADLREALVTTSPRVRVRAYYSRLRGLRAQPGPQRALCASIGSGAD